jgi:osmotically-inducible protein OsmY
MKHPSLRTSLVVAALFAGGAYAGHSTLNNSSYVPGASTYNVPMHGYDVSASGSADVGAVPAAEPSTLPVAAPVAEARVEPGIEVTEQRLSEDERIQLQVMDKLAGNPRLSGKIGVEAEGRVVRLSGYTLTSGQARHAERDAWSVSNVKHVVNEIRPRVGAITS